MLFCHLVTVTVCVPGVCMCVRTCVYTKKGSIIAGTILKVVKPLCEVNNTGHHITLAYYIGKPRIIKFMWI